MAVDTSITLLLSLFLYITNNSSSSCKMVLGVGMY
jgi:hypothetical protein